MEGASQSDLRATFRRYGRDELRLRPIDLLVKHRELFGFSVLDSLDALVMACVTAGPEQSHLSRPLVDDGATLVRNLQDCAALREFVRDELGFTLETGHLTKEQFQSHAVPRLMQTMETARWARTADSRHLRINLQSLHLTQQVASDGNVLPTIFPNAFRVRTIVSWRSVVGKELAETHASGAELFQLNPTTTSATSTTSSSHQQQHDSQNEILLPGEKNEFFFDSNNKSLNSTTTSSTSLGASITNSGGDGLFASVSSMSRMSSSTEKRSQNVPEFVEISTMFRTTCSSSCTIRVSVDTPSGLEFAHGIIRASFLPGEAAPCASFSVPLVRPASLQAMKQTTTTKQNSSSSHQQQHHNEKEKSSTSASTSPSSSNNNKSHGRSLSSTILSALPKFSRKKKDSQSNSAGSGSASASTTTTSHSTPNLSHHLHHSHHNNAPEEQVLVGSLSIDIDSIASQFSNLVAMTRQERMMEEPQEESSPEETAAKSTTQNQNQTQGFHEGIIADENGSTVAFFLKRLHDQSPIAPLWSGTKKKKHPQFDDDEENDDDENDVEAKKKLEVEDEEENQQPKRILRQAPPPPPPPPPQKKILIPIFTTTAASTSTTVTPKQKEEVKPKTEVEKKKSQVVEKASNENVSATSSSSSSSSPPSSSTIPPAPPKATATKPVAKKGHSNAKKYFSSD